MSPEHPRHPMQPIVEEKGVRRFKRNSIVERLLDNGPFDLNAIARWDVSDDDRVQLAQLIGYTVNGFCELSYVDGEAYHLAQEGGPTSALERLSYYMELVKRLREMLKLPMAELYEKHPDDFEV